MNASKPVRTEYTPRSTAASVISWGLRVSLTGLGGVDIIVTRRTQTEVAELATETGKRYFCEKCSAEFVVTRGSEEGAIFCCGQPMSRK